MFSVRWAVSDADSDLDVVEMVVYDSLTDVNFAVQDVNGGTASGWQLFQFPVDNTLDVTLRAKDEAGHTVKNTTTITL